jgi:hypothetical protein
MTREGLYSVRPCPRCGADNPSFTRECACGQRFTTPGTSEGHMSEELALPESSGARMGPERDHQLPREVAASWGRATRVYWAILWRSIAVGLPLGAGLGCIVGFMAAFLGGHQTMLVGRTIPVLILGMLIGVGVHVWATRAVLRKRFRDFRVALIAD